MSQSKISMFLVVEIPVYLRFISSFTRFLKTWIRIILLKQYFYISIYLICSGKVQGPTVKSNRCNVSMCKWMCKWIKFDIGSMYWRKYWPPETGVVRDFNPTWPPYEVGHASHHMRLLWLEYLLFLFHIKLCVLYLSNHRWIVSEMVIFGWINVDYSS